MKKLFPCLSLVFFLAGQSAFSQVYLTLTDNLVITGNSLVKIAAGNYTLQDAGLDGLIQISNASNIVIDGDSVEVNGVNYTGYAIKIDQSHNIEIKNFTTVNHFNYAVYITNSSNVSIHNCNFSYNKVDSSGFIDVWAGYAAALGGGVMCYNCDSINVYGNLMKYQNDGVALYNSRFAHIHENDFSWNTSYGIRMFYTDSSYIHHNNCIRVNRPLTDPSDCAALLMIVSNVNRVEFNDLRFSGDGVFLGQYQHHLTPNRNYFAYNDCSGSPHNAIEATFADGNVYKQNVCNSSHYGLWLGYSFNSIVDSNMVMYNNNSGIAIDRGFNNVITNNWIVENPIGIELWEGSPISGYQTQTSHDYRIDSNLFEGNTIAVKASASEHLTARQNQFIKNYDGVQFLGNSSLDTLTLNLFDQSLRFDMMNNSTFDIQATDNIFSINDTNYIAAKIDDQADTAANGRILWKPFTGQTAPVYVTSPPAELSEPPSVWYPYPEICWWMGNPVPLTITWDTLEVKTGSASVHLTTGTGWYVSCSYRDSGNRIPRWDLTNYGYLSFWIKSNNANLGAFQYFHVRVGNLNGGYYRYESTGAVLNQSLGQWRRYIVPLFGGNGWPRTQVGNVYLNDINYIEVYTDTYGVGYELWLDGVEFLFAQDIAENELSAFSANLFPNPVKGWTTLSFSLPEKEKLQIRLFDTRGRMVKEIYSGVHPAGLTEMPVDVSCLSDGVYYVQWLTSGNASARRLVVVK